MARRILCVLPLEPPAVDRAVLIRLAGLCQAFSPVVGLEEGDSPECLLLDVTGTAPLFGGEAELTRQLQAAFLAQGFRARIAIADTLGAAWAGARAGSDLGFGIWDLGNANRASACARIPNPKSQIPNPIGILPIAALRLSEGTVERLRQLGLRSIAQVEALPRASLASRFGEELTRRLDQALGRLPEVISCLAWEPPLEADFVCDPPLERLDHVRHVLGTLLSRLLDRLAPRRQGIVELASWIYTPPHSPLSVPLVLFRPSGSAGHLGELLELRLERLRLAAPVCGLRIAATCTAPLEERQLALVQGSVPGDSRDLDRLVDRLAARLGNQAVLRPSLRPDAQPEHACRYEPLVGPPAAAKKAAPPPPPVVPRPVRFCDPPRPLEVWSVAPDGPPFRFRWRGRDHQIALACGPERIETGWWRGAAALRDYYRVQTAAGHWFWLFRGLAEGKWFLQGWFE